VHQLSDIQKDVLLRVADDVEAPHTIAADMSRDLGTPVSEVEALAILLELVHLGAVSVFEYSPAAQDYIHVDASQASTVADPWFRAKRDAVVQLVSPRA
jgi:predicted SpoU family rRNA methylase